MVALLDPRWIQVDFSTLVGLFDRLNLQTNVGKTVGMVYQLCQEAGIQLEETYGRRMIGEGLFYQERQRGQIQ